MGTIDRKKHDIDVVERVLGQGDDEVGERDGRTEVISVDVRPGFVSSTSSSSQITVGALAPPDHDRERGRGDE
jgi:hypothetical protein